MTPAVAERSGAKLHWQAAKDFCAHGHDIRAYMRDGERVIQNPNVAYRADTGARQCVACNRLRARLGMRTLYRARLFAKHCQECQECLHWLNNGADVNRCELGRIISKLLKEAMDEQKAAGFGRKQDDWSGRRWPD